MKRIAVVGFGFMGRMHYANWKKMKGAQVVALCDRDLSQFSAPVAKANLSGADTSTDFGKAKIYDDFDKMLAEAKPDIVDITLPTPLHPALTAKALKLGIHVICEKPMALDAAACKTMLKAKQAAPKGTQLMIAHCLRFWPAYVYLKKLVDSQKYGKVVAASFRRYSPPPGWGKGKSWFLDESKSGGVALDLHIHDTDMVHFLFGLPKSVTSTAIWGKDGYMQHISTIYDVGGPVVTSDGSWAINPTMGFEASYHVTFEKAVAILDFKRAKPLCVYPAKGEAIEPKLAAGDGYEYELNWFLDSVNGKKVPCVITPEQSAASVRIVDAEKKSAKTKKTVKL
jgi:1,5-anhydro-D-fructose reductase (1,5-anhydro-D-mannitol-forming)